MTADELNVILDAHRLANGPNGKRADLRDAVLWRADLTGALISLGNREITL